MINVLQTETNRLNAEKFIASTVKNDRQKIRFKQF